MTSLFTSQKNYLNLSITLICGSTSGFLSSYLCLCCPEFSPLDTILPVTPLLSDLLIPLILCAGISTQTGVVVIQ